MQESGYLRYYRREEGSLFSPVEISLKAFGLAEQAAACEFWQADSANMLAKYTGYDLILAENVLERSSNPQRFLNMIHERLNPKGILLIADAYAWQDAITLPENHLGGFRKDGEPYRNFEGLSAVLESNFTLLCPPSELLQALRNNGRSWNLLQTQVSIWKRN